MQNCILRICHMIMPQPSRQRLKPKHEHTRTETNTNSYNVKCSKQVGSMPYHQAHYLATLIQHGMGCPMHRYTKTNTNANIEIRCHILHTSAPCPPPHNLAALIQHRRGPRCLGLAQSHFLTLSPGRAPQVVPSCQPEWENME